MSSDNQRYLIVGAGRSGSTLLASILADAGANFSMKRIESWDGRAGAYEHPLILDARRWHSRAAKVDESLIPNRLGHGYCLQRMYNDLKTLLSGATFVKSTDLFFMVPAIAYLGYTPKVIVSYRPFDEHARSRHRKNSMDVASLIADYVNIYRTAALQLQIFGGGVVSYDELVHSEQAEWAAMVGDLTGIPTERILAARSERVKTLPRKPIPFDLPVADPAVEQIEATYASLLGRVIEPV